MTDVKFYNPSLEPSGKLIYSVIAARCRGKWVFVRHHKKDTFEIPAGHIEAGETSLQAAERELEEETGALEFSIECVSTYSVTTDGKTGWGRLYFAEISEIGPVPDTCEIAEIVFDDHFKEPNTHPFIQPHMFNRILQHLKENNL